MTLKKCKFHGDLEQDQIDSENRCKLCRIITKVKKEYKLKICIHHGELTEDLIKGNGACRLCHRASANSKRNNSREEFNKRQALDKLKNPEKWNEIYKKDYQKQKAKFGKLLSLKKCCDARGITVEQYYEMEKAQNYVCAICHLPEMRINGVTKVTGRLVIDHCHKTNKVRGLLCHACNSSIGKLQEDTIRLIRAARYIKSGGFYAKCKLQ